LGISEVDPLRFGLRLERFLHAGREDLPDIDLDVAAQYRTALFTWVVRHFGQHHVARVGSWHRYGPRSALAAAAAAHGVPPAHVRPLVEALGDDLDRLGEPVTAEGLDVPPGTFPLEPAEWPKVLASARLLLGRPSELGTHPSGVLLTAQPVEDYAPLQKGRAG